MKPRSLRMRLLLGAAVAILVALTAAWLAMTLLFERHIQRRAEAELTRAGMQLAAGTTIDPFGRPVLGRDLGDSRFMTPAGGAYWQVTGRAGSLRSRSLWDASLPVSDAARPGAWSARVIAGPFEDEVLLVERIVRPDPGGESVLLQLGVENESLNRARDEFAAELSVFLVLLWIILSAGAWSQVVLGLQPLVAVRNQVNTLKNNPRARLGAGHVEEIEPLTRAINELADARERDLDKARRRAADLAHGLKTPLAALAAQSRRARVSGATDAADGLDRAISAANAAVERELVRARAAAILASSSVASTAVSSLIDSIVGVIERTEFGSQLVFDVNVPDDLVAPVAAEDLLELMGALIENAARYGRRRIHVGGSTSSSGGIELSVDDDGPGIGPELMSQAIERGGRLDELNSGHGLGLAIAADLAEATRGKLKLARSALGGLKVAVEWSTTAANSRHRAR